MTLRLASPFPAESDLQNIAYLVFLRLPLLTLRGHLGAATLKLLLPYLSQSPLNYPNLSSQWILLLFQVFTYIA